jgi:hypothetical protein
MKRPSLHWLKQNFTVELTKKEKKALYKIYENKQPIHPVYKEWADEAFASIVKQIVENNYPDFKKESYTDSKTWEDSK